jgi:hypothetical protein
VPGSNLHPLIFNRSRFSPKIIGVVVHLGGDHPDTPLSMHSFAGTPILSSEVSCSGGRSRTVPPRSCGHRHAASGRVRPRLRPVAAVAAAPSQMWVTRTSRDLVAGSGIVFALRGAHVLKGVSGARELLAAG